MQRQIIVHPRRTAIRRGLRLTGMSDDLPLNGYARRFRAGANAVLL